LQKMQVALYIFDSGEREVCDISVRRKHCKKMQRDAMPLNCSDCTVRKCAATCVFKLDEERGCVHFVNVAAEDAHNNSRKVCTSIKAT
jgi:hypothetical protein